MPRCAIGNLGARDRPISSGVLSGGADVQYGGQTFASASRFVQRHANWVGPYEPAHGETEEWCSRWSGAAALARVLVSLPRVDARLSLSESGREIDTYLGTRARGVHHHRIAQGILKLPRHIEEYLRGRSRQAVRTNLRRADAAGIDCILTSHHEQRRSAAAALGISNWVDPPRDPVWIARAGSKDIGILWATIDTQWALLRALEASQSEARYALHTALVAELCAKGVTYLFAQGANALLLPTGQQYFQKLLGYGVAHLRLRGAST